MRSARRDHNLLREHKTKIEAQTQMKNMQLNKQSEQFCNDCANNGFQRLKQRKYVLFNKCQCKSAQKTRRNQDTHVGVRRRDPSEVRQRRPCIEQDFCGNRKKFKLFDLWREMKNIYWDTTVCMCVFITHRVNVMDGTVSSVQE